MVESELKHYDKIISDSFLSTFTEMVEPHSNLLATYIISTKILQQLQEEKELTYGDLFECLNQLITDPIMADKNSRFKGMFFQIVTNCDKYTL